MKTIIRNRFYVFVANTFLRLLLSANNYYTARVTFTLYIFPQSSQASLAHSDRHLPTWALKFKHLPIFAAKLALNTRITGVIVDLADVCHIEKVDEILPNHQKSCLVELSKP